MSSINQKSNSSLQKQANATSNKSSTSSPTLKSMSGLSRNTSRSPKSRNSIKSPISKRSPSPKSRLKQSSIVKTEDQQSDVDETEKAEYAEEKALLSESIVEEPPIAEKEQPIVISLCFKFFKLFYIF